VLDWQAAAQSASVRPQPRGRAERSSRFADGKEQLLDPRAAKAWLADADGAQTQTKV
jgi:hypothetical protein